MLLKLILVLLAIAVILLIVVPFLLFLYAKMITGGVLTGMQHSTRIGVDDVEKRQRPSTTTIDRTTES